MGMQLIMVISNTTSYYIIEMRLNITVNNPSVTLAKGGTDIVTPLLYILDQKMVSNLYL